MIFNNFFFFNFPITRILRRLVKNPIQQDSYSKAIHRNASSINHGKKLVRMLTSKEERTIFIVLVAFIIEIWHSQHMEEKKRAIAFLCCGGKGQKGKSQKLGAKRKMNSRFHVLTLGSHHNSFHISKCGLYQIEAWKISRCFLLLDWSITHVAPIAMLLPNC